MRMIDDNVYDLSPPRVSRQPDELVYEVYVDPDGQVTFCVYSATMQLESLHRGKFWRQPGAVRWAISRSEEQQALNMPIILPNRQPDHDAAILRFDCSCRGSLIIYGPARALEIDPFKRDTVNKILGVS